MKKDKINKSIKKVKKSKSIKSIKSIKKNKSTKKRQRQNNSRKVNSSNPNVKNIPKNKTLKGGKDNPTAEDYKPILISNPEGKNTALSSSNSSYNDNLFVRESHNCYTYFLNLKNKDAVELCKKDFNKNNYCRRAQPGYLSGHPNLTTDDYKCPTIMNRTLNDNPNIYKINSITDKCHPEYYKGALVVAPGRDYHYYRYNDDNQWSHKPGYKPSTIYDSNNNRILNPEIAAKDYGGTLNYKNFCGYMCIPRDSKKKNMAHRNYSLGSTERPNKFTNNKFKEHGNKQKNTKPTNGVLQTLGKKVSNIISSNDKSN